MARTTVSVNQVLTVIEAAARAAGRVLVEAFAGLDSLHVKSKGPSDFVSEADFEAEAAIRAVLDAAYPNASWRGEETGYSEGSSVLEWVVDPLDGTTNFLSGIPHYAVSIALREGGRTTAGVVYNPMSEDLFSATLGAGATRNGQSIHVSSRDDWEYVVLGTGIPHHGSAYHHTFAAELAIVRDRVAGVRRFGAAALDLAYVACGRFDGFWERGLAAWDVSAGNLLVREAGGVVTGIEAERDPDSDGSVIAATPWLHGQLAALLRGAGNVANPGESDA